MGAPQVLFDKSSIRSPLETEKDMKVVSFRLCKQCISYLVPNNKSPPNLAQLPHYIIAGSPGQDTMYAEIGTLSQVFSEGCHQIYSAILLLSRTTRDNNIMDISKR